MTTLSSFQDLKKIGKELEEKARAAEEERKRAQALKEKQAHDAQTFASAMSNMGVEPIRTKKVRGASSPETRTDSPSDPG